MGEIKGHCPSTDAENNCFKSNYKTLEAKERPSKDKWKELVMLSLNINLLAFSVNFPSRRDSNTANMFTCLFALFGTHMNTGAT